MDEQRLAGRVVLVGTVLTGVAFGYWQHDMAAAAFMIGVLVVAAVTVEAAVRWRR